MSLSVDVPPAAAATSEQPAEVVWVGEGRQLGQEKNFHYYGVRIGGRMILVGDVVLLNSGDPATPFIAWVEQLFETFDGTKVLRTRWLYRRSECEQWGITIPPVVDDDVTNEVFLTDQVDDNVVASASSACTVILPDLGVQLQPASESTETFRCTHMFQTSPRPAFTRLKPLSVLEPILTQRAQREVLWAEQHVRRPPGGGGGGGTASPATRKRARSKMEDDDSSMDAVKRRRVESGAVVEWQHVWTIGEPLETTLPPGSLSSRGYLLDLIDRLEEARGGMPPSQSEKSGQQEETLASPGIAAPMMPRARAEDKQNQSPVKQGDGDTTANNTSMESAKKGASHALEASSAPEKPMNASSVHHDDDEGNDHDQDPHAALPRALARVSPHLHQTRRQDVRMGAEHQSESPAQQGAPGTAKEIPVPSGDAPASAATAPAGEIPLGGMPIDPERDLMTGNEAMWSLEEETAFAISFTRLGKQYSRIAANIPGKTVHDVIAYYFRNKKRHLEPDGQVRRVELARQVARRPGAEVPAGMSMWLMDDDALRAQALQETVTSDLHRHALATPPPPHETLDVRRSGSSVNRFSVQESGSMSEDEAAENAVEQEQVQQLQHARDTQRRTGVPSPDRQVPLGARLARRAVRRPGQWWIAPDLAVCSLCHETREVGEPSRLLWCAVPTCRRTVCARCYRIDALAYRTRESKTTFTGATQNAFWCCLDCCPPPPEALLPPGPEDLFLHGEEDDAGTASWQREEASAWIGWSRALEPAVEAEARNLLQPRSDPTSVDPEAITSAIQETQEDMAYRKESSSRKVSQRVGRWTFMQGSDSDSVAAAMQAFASGTEGVGTDSTPEGVAVPRENETRRHVSSEAADAGTVAEGNRAPGETGTPVSLEEASSSSAAAAAAGPEPSEAPDADWETLQQSRGRRRRRAAELADMGRLALAIQEGRRRVGSATVVETQAQRSLRLAQRELVRASHVSVHDALLFLRAVELRYGTSRRMRKFVQALTAYREGKWTARDFARRCLRLFRDDADLQRAMLVFLPVELREVYQWSIDAVQRAAAVEAATIARRVAEQSGFEEDSDNEETSRNEAQGGSAE